jgi:hypothetical protein
MLLVVTATKVEELLTRGEEVRHVLKQPQVLDVGDHRHESGGFLDSVLIFELLFEVNYLCGRRLLGQVATEKYTLSFDTLAKDCDVRVLVLAGSLSLVHKLGSIVKNLLSLKARVTQLSVVGRELDIGLD